MPFLQKLIMALLPRKWAAAAEADSRDWMMHCPTCGREFSVWEAGGVRYKPKGNPKTLMWCPGCKHKVWGHFYRKSLKSQTTAGKTE